MQNNVASLVIFTSLLILAPTASAEMWHCAYDGTWDTFANDNAGTFNWRVVWQSDADDSWNVTGDYSDRYGDSTLNGSCDSDSCLLEQTYENGELAGDTYYWKGDYTDDGEGSTVINSFTGSWGTNSKANDGGEWKAIATCTRG